MESCWENIPVDLIWLPALTLGVLLYRTTSPHQSQHSIYSCLNLSGQIGLLGNITFETFFVCFLWYGCTNSNIVLVRWYFSAHTQLLFSSVLVDMPEYMPPDARLHSANEITILQGSSSAALLHGARLSSGWIINIPAHLSPLICLFSSHRNTCCQSMRWICLPTNVHLMRFVTVDLKGKKRYFRPLHRINTWNVCFDSALSQSINRYQDANRCDSSFEVVSRFRHDGPDLIIGWETILFLPFDNIWSDKTRENKLSHTITHCLLDSNAIFKTPQTSDPVHITGSMHCTGSILYIDYLNNPQVSSL